MTGFKTAYNNPMRQRFTTVELRSGNGGSDQGASDSTWKSWSDFSNVNEVWVWAHAFTQLSENDGLHFVSIFHHPKLKHVRFLSPHLDDALVRWIALHALQIHRLAFNVASDPQRVRELWPWYMVQSGVPFHELCVPRPESWHERVPRLAHGDVDQLDILEQAAMRHIAASPEVRIWSVESSGDPQWKWQGGSEQTATFLNREVYFTLWSMSSDPSKLEQRTDCLVTHGILSAHANDLPAVAAALPAYRIAAECLVPPPRTSKGHQGQTVDETVNPSLHPLGGRRSPGHACARHRAVFAALLTTDVRSVVRQRPQSFEQAVF